MGNSFLVSSNTRYFYLHTIPAMVLSCLCGEKEGFDAGLCCCDKLLLLSFYFTLYSVCLIEHLLLQIREVFWVADREDCAREGVWVMKVVV